MLNPARGGASAGVWGRNPGAVKLKETKKAKSKVILLSFREAGKIIGESFTFIARTFVPGITGSFMMVLAIYAWHYVSDALSPVLRLGGSVLLGTVVYVGFLWMTRRELFYEIRELVGRR